MNLNELIAAIQPGVHLPETPTGHMIKPFDTYLDCLGSMSPDAVFFGFGLLSAIIRHRLKSLVVVDSQDYVGTNLSENH